jgi:hypothetical protein
MGGDRLPYPSTRRDHRPCLRREALEAEPNALEFVKDGDHGSARGEDEGSAAPKELPKHPADVLKGELRGKPQGCRIIANIWRAPTRPASPCRGIGCAAGRDPKTAVAVRNGPGVSDRAGGLAAGAGARVGFGTAYERGAAGGTV